MKLIFKTPCQKSLKAIRNLKVKQRLLPQLVIEYSMTLELQIIVKKPLSDLLVSNNNNNSNNNRSFLNSDENMSPSFSKFKETKRQTPVVVFLVSPKINNK